VLALVGDPVAPGLRLGVQVGEIPEAAAGPEVLPQEFYGVFHAALLVPAGHVAGHRAEAVVARVGEEARVEAHELPLPLGDHGGGVVVPGLPRAPADPAPGRLVATQERFERLAEGEEHRE
jgi:hypothetical protein